MISKKNFAALCASASILASTSPAFAAEHGHGEGPAAVYIVGVVINFIIFVWLLVKYAKPALSKKYKEQREALIQNLDAAKKLREEAEKKLNDYQARLDGLEKERKEILDRYHQQGEVERDRLVSDAKTQIERLRLNAENVIKQEQLRAIKELEQEAIDLAVKLAEDKLKLRANADTDQRLIEQLSLSLKQKAV